jgi:transcription factor TFIIIB component B''
VDGKIVVHGGGTTTVGQAPMDAETSASLMVKTTETVSVTSASFSRRARAIRWSVDDTRRFYQSLRQCGTDFEMLAQLFPRRTRRHLKLKFKKEERGTSIFSYYCRTSTVT